jgi:TolB-like protein
VPTFRGCEVSGVYGWRTMEDDDDDVARGSTPMNTRLITLALMTTLAGSVLAADAPRVLVVPFDGAGPADKAWIAKALQQNLVAELSRVNSVEPVTSDKVPADKPAAVKAAKDAGAQFVVFGAYQVVDADLRITGQVLDVVENQTVAGLKATGTQRDLFGLGVPEHVRRRVERRGEGALHLRRDHVFEPEQITLRAGRL